MKFLSNAHTHTTYCDGASTVAEQLAAARRLGFVSLGFSGHAMQGFDWAYCMDADAQTAYLQELRAHQAAFSAASQPLRLWVGLEQDALVPPQQKAQNRAACDYLLGSAHYFPEPMAGEWVSVDGSPELLNRYIAAHFAGDPLAMAATYYRLHSDAILADRPDIIGHFDLVRKHAAAIGLDLASPAYREAALAALAAARRGCAIMEVNTGNIARGYDTTPYPAAFLLDAWQDLGGELTLTSDCHNAALLDCAFEPTLAMLRARGWKRVLRLGTGAALWDAFAL